MPEELQTITNSHALEALNPNQVGADMEVLPEQTRLMPPHDVMMARINLARRIHSGESAETLASQQRIIAIARRAHQLGLNGLLTENLTKV